MTTRGAKRRMSQPGASCSTLDVTNPPNVGGQPRAAPARPGFLPEDAARLGGWSALFGSPPFPRTALVVLSTPRSASLTASSEGKAAATSGSSKTKLLPLRSRATYLPRPPPFLDAKSYSGRRSLSLCRFALFIELSLAPRRSTGADDADGVVSLRVGHNQDVSRVDAPIVRKRASAFECTSSANVVDSGS